MPRWARPLETSELKSFVAQSVAAYATMPGAADARSTKKRQQAAARDDYLFRVTAEFIAKNRLSLYQKARLLRELESALREHGVDKTAAKSFRMRVLMRAMLKM